MNNHNNIIIILVNYFYYLSQISGQIIISESHLPPSSRTILPIDGLGLHGGTKYVVQDMIFKFATDKQVFKE